MRKLSRNDFCWCGSGKKYKKCHMVSDIEKGSNANMNIIVPRGIIIKTDEQIQGIRKSSHLARKTLDMLDGKIKAGISTEEINSLVHEYITQNGAIPAPLG